MNSFFELVKTRRSIRKYQDKPVEPEKIKQITTAALMSPASKRSNPWEFVVVQDKDTMQKLSECRPNGSKLLENAPLGIVVVADTTKSDVWFEDASIASIIIQLQAQELGLGSCWVQVYNREKEEGQTASDYICTLLNIPMHYAVLNVVSIGYPDEERKPYDEEKLSYDKIHEEKF
ncbi:NAD(P)H nitroreductase [Paludibacter sp. 221]|uniref:nitroreductase family protein n=1 Tax=Paludibacter sp. 221 TaxID=2302939 RepID=UPI0013D6CFB1|nr:nitroreductase family protein [Paludibacter sp. 221]NDV46962.1 NAD(P)H nitroreductase [Paludibacter sp. 221]